MCFISGWSIRFTVRTVGLPDCRGAEFLANVETPPPCLVETTLYNICPVHVRPLAMG